jgi:NUMOD3 motif/Putative endonuclease segE, GIY-YIG domain
MIESIPFTYLLKHIPTNKYYYGVRYRKGCHPKDLWKTYFTSSKKVKGLIKKYGKKSFIFEIRKIFKTQQQALNWEHKVLKKMKVIHRNDFLNQTDNKCFDPILISKTMKTKTGIKNSFYGKTHSAEARKKISLGNLGRKHTKESIEKLRLANLGKNNPMYGKPRTEEVKQKLRLANLGKKHTKESIEKLRLAKLGKNNAMYGKRGKLSPSYGKKHTKETIQKIKLAKLAYWKNIKNKIGLSKNA